MNFQKNSLRNTRAAVNAYAVSFVIFILLGIGVRIFSLLFFYDADVGYYKTGAILPYVLNALLITAFFLGGTALFALPAKGLFGVLPPTCVFTKAGSAFACGSVLTHIAYTLFEQRNMGDGVSKIDIAIIFFGIGALVYFLSAFFEKASGSGARVMFGYSVIFYAVLILAKTYFDFGKAMNSPNKLLLQLTFMMIMLYMLCELRYALKIELPRAYVACSLVTVTMAFVCSIPGMVAFFLGIFESKEYLFAHFVCFGFGVYIALRFLSWLSSEQVRVRKKED